MNAFRIFSKSHDGITHLTCLSIYLYGTLTLSILTTTQTDGKPEVCKFLKKVKIDINITQTFHVNTTLHSFYKVSW